MTSSPFIRCAIGIAVMSFAVTTASTSASADPADDIVAALGYNDYYTSLSNLMVEQAVQKLQSLKVSADKIAVDRPKIQADAASYRAIFLTSVAKSYRAHFTPAELVELMKFYGSPLGRKVGEAQNPIKDEVAAASTAAGMYIGVQTAQLVK